MQEQPVYVRHPSVYQDRRAGKHGAAWVRQFQCEDMSPLIICRGPVRKEAMDVFEQMGIRNYGILLSAKDAIVHTNALAPELRAMNDRKRVHHVSDYTGADQAERTARVREIIEIAKQNGYDSIFAGYGFMAEEEGLVSEIEDAGLAFIGPCSTTVRSAGRKDVAKRTALAESISVTPGIDNSVALALIDKCGDLAGLQSLASQHGLTVEDGELEVVADALLDQALDAGIDLVSPDEILASVRKQVHTLFTRYPDRRLRIKAVGGGGGKGQRVLSAPTTFPDDDPKARVDAAADLAAERTREVWSEVKAGEPGANKNILIELNIDTNRHQEIQVIGNGNWCVSLGARDCSAQMHEQKLVEVSVTDESLRREISACRDAGQLETAEALETDLQILQDMEAEAARFGKAVGLDSVSTFECIVDGADHYFMEMNTRIQVEHRVTELCYTLEFANPDDPSDVLRVDSLIEAMTLIARHGEQLPEPSRVPRYHDSVEIRLNATDDALAPYAGGTIGSWSDCGDEEIRDDQGISIRNPDTGIFMPYYLAGAYDSNIALLLTHGHSRQHTYEQMLDVLRQTRLTGKDLETNLEFHYGIINWLVAQNVRAKIETRFVSAYLAAVGRMYVSAQNVDLDAAYARIRQKSTDNIGSNDVKAGYQRVMDLKQTLILRPLKTLLARPHVLAGWIASSAKYFELANGQLRWLTNPVDVLHELYRFLNMLEPDQPAAEVIWDHDNEILGKARAFYARLQTGLSPSSFRDLDTMLCETAPPTGAPAAFEESWESLRAMHAGYQHGLQVLELPQRIARETEFHHLRVKPDLNVEIPPQLLDPDTQAKMRKALVPAPTASHDELVAEYGGMFYAREAPGTDRYLEPGSHFEIGDPLYVIEVMKMFNKVYATFSGTVDEILMGDQEGMVVRKGQTLFKVTPDERAEEVDPQEVRRIVVEHTQLLADACLEV